MSTPLEALGQAKIPCYLHSYSALDRYFRVREPGPIHVLTRSTLVDLARLFDDITYTGNGLADAALTHGESRYLFRCVDEDEHDPRGSYTVLDLLYDTGRDVFLDPRAVYPDLRKPGLTPSPIRTPEYVTAIMDAALIVSRYHYVNDVVESSAEPSFPSLPAAVQRDLLVSILSSRRPDKGLRLLAATGFLAAYWPELDVLAQVAHTKDHHPEGDVWEHTLQTFAHRKTIEVPLALGLLFHDVGKAVAPATRQRAFDAHAEHGARIATKFLRRLEMSDTTVDAVDFLVRYHMMPPALPRMPEYRVAPLMESPHFPDLLELYYADLSSSYRSPEGYYNACRLYKGYLKKRGTRHPETASSQPPRQRKRSHFR